MSTILTLTPALNDNILEITNVFNPIVFVNVDKDSEKPNEKP